MDAVYILLLCLVFVKLGCCSKCGSGEYIHECLRTCEYPPKPKMCEYEFVAEWINTMSANCFDCPFNQDDCYLDGCVTVDGTSRPIIVTNGKMPGPSIQVCQGDTIRVNVINKLQDHGGLSIHWHGMYQTGTNWMDGASMITQCPITSSSSFTYQFKANPPGTHWWHGHSGFQRSDGIYGSLIIRKPKEVEQISDEYDLDVPEHVILLTDWRDHGGLFVTVQLFSNSVYVNDEINLLPMLINGRAIGDTFLDEDGNTFFTPLTTFEVEEGLRYRFRVISAAYGFCNTQVSVEAHSLRMISLDGSDVMPKTVDSFIIAPGESYDFVLTANATPASSYCMYFYGMPNSKCSGNGTAILRYKNRIDDDEDFTCESVPTTPASLTETPTFSILDTHSFDPVDPALYSVDEKYYVLLTFFRNQIAKDDGTVKAVIIHNQIDYISFTYPPSLLLTKDPINFTLCEANKYRSAYSSCKAEICKCTTLLKMNVGQVVEFIIINDDDWLAHSMHLHGHNFRVMAQESVTDISSLTLANMISLDEKGMLPRVSPHNAVVKDTVDVPTTGYAIIRWKADNPGYWFFHCHSDAHLETGMAMIVQVGDHEEITMPPPDFPNCGPWTPDD
ncbi:laccase-4-like isoform X2 [Anneissia japonica]|uniref:laccase-4-like isoform X2 n=1 Tax=Anneissia japonica TaxID=1529436 RepID=UPI001425582F|nr:laccase-4-like isoform X2 [Anneissia japonica]